MSRQASAAASSQTVNTKSNFVSPALANSSHDFEPVCTENLIRVDDVMESPKLAE